MVASYYDEVGFERGGGNRAILLPGETVTVYQDSPPGTQSVSLQSLFSDELLAVPLANPFTADGLGNLVFWADATWVWVKVGTRAARRVRINQIGATGLTGAAGTAAAATYTYAGLPSAATPGLIANVSTNVKGYFRSNGETWQKVGGKVVHAEDFGVSFSTAASPVDTLTELIAARDALGGLPGEIHINPPPAINTSGIGYDQWLNVSAPFILLNGQSLVATGGQPGPNGASSGLGVTFRAMDAFAGVAVIMGNSWFADPVNDYDHGVQVHGVSVECRNVAANGFAFNQLGEASLLSQCAVWRATEAAYKLVGAHASAVLFECSGWECPTIVKTTSHPDEAATLSGGNLRTYGLSGDDNDRVFYVDGSLHLTAVGTKSEATPVGVEVASVAATGTGGAAAVLTFLGGTFADPDTGDTFAKVTGAVARPIISMRGTFLTGYPNLIEDAVRSITETITARYAFLIADWTYGGSSEYGGGGEVIFRDGFKMVRPDTFAIVNAFQYTSDLLMTVRGGFLGSALEDNLGNKVKFQNTKMIFGNDANVYRSAADVLATDDDFAVVTAGKTLKIKEGTNAKMGSSVLAAGSVVVSTTAVTATSRIYVTSQVDGGTPGFLRVSARTAATSFTITSSSGSDTSTVAWFIVEPA